jgi:plastocyanin
MITTEMTGPYSYIPESVTISVGDIVMFSPRSIHNVVPHTSLPTDPGLTSGATGEVRCVQFTTPGEFHYQCSPHPTTMGVVRVQ